MAFRIEQQQRGQAAAMELVKDGFPRASAALAWLIDRCIRDGEALDYINDTMPDGSKCIYAWASDIYGEAAGRYWIGEDVWAAAETKGE